MNKIAHGIVLAGFAAACWFVWALLQLPRMVRLKGMELQPPAFTKLCVEIGPVILTGFGIVALGYCMWVWFRKESTPRAWVGFLATTTGLLFLVTLPVVVAIYLSLISALQSISTR